MTLSDSTLSEKERIGFEQQSSHALLAPETIDMVEDPVKLRKVIHMGVGFFFLFTAFMTAQNLVSTIYDDLNYKSLGQTTLLVLYGFFWFAVFLTPGLVKNWSYKKGVFVGSLGYMFTMFAGALTTACSAKPDLFYCHSTEIIYMINIICAAANGFTAPILWLSANSYVTGCANAQNKGKYLGIFASFTAGANLMGSIMAAFVIKLFGQFSFYLVCSGFAVLAIVIFALAPHVEKYNSPQAEESLIDKAKKMVKLAFNKRMIPLIPYILYVGLVLAIYSGFEYQIIKAAVPNQSKDEQTVTIALVMSLQGFTTIVTSYVAGKLADVMRRRTVLYIFNVFYLFAIILSYLAYHRESLFLSYAMAFCWGAGYSGALALQNIVMAKDFEGTLEAYGVVQAFSNMATIVGFGLTIALSTNIVAFLLVCAGLLVVNQGSLFFYQQKNDDKVIV